MARTGLRILGISLLLVAVYIASAPLRRHFEIDSCLDGGGSFDYTAGYCDYQQTYLGERYVAPAYVPWVAAAVFALVGGLLLFYSRKLGRGHDMRANTSLERTRER